MQRFAKLFVASLLVLLLWSPNSFAVGLGVFVDGSGGSGEAEWDSDFDSWDIDSRAGAMGFVLDTAPTDECVFNYRLNVGFAKHELEDDNNLELKSNGVFAENIFGFALIKQQDFRWWAGPLVRVGYYSGDTDTVWTGTNTFRVDVDYAEFGIGAVTGLNFKAGNVVLSPSIGVRYSAYAGEGEIQDNFGTFTEDIEADATNVFANFAILF